jgi:hypothetical protein
VNLSILSNLKLSPKAFICTSLLIGIGLFSSCQLQNEIPFEGSEFTLRFSQDTVFFDTVFTEQTTTTQRLKVYNDYDGLITIGQIAMSGANSPFQITVNGFPSDSFEEIKILGGDSLLVLLEANIDAENQDNPYIVEDRLQFTSAANNQEVPIIAWGQDANYLRDSVLVCNTTWTAGKPYVIYDNILIDSLCTLTIEPGARIYSHVNSNIYVKGQMTVNGTSQNRVVFANDRFDEPFASAPGQWNGITFLVGSSGNRISYADIKNAVNGIWLGTPDDNTEFDLVVNNCIIENMSQSGVLAFTSDVSLQNTLINNCRQFAFAGLAGGNYQLLQSTFANYAYGMIKQEPTMAITDYLELNDGSAIGEDVNLEIINSIIWGPDTEELALLNQGEFVFTLSIQNSLLKTSNTDLDVNDNLLNMDPLFVDSRAFDYQLSEGSPAIDAGLDIGFMGDLNDSLRTPPVDIGAYEFKIP